MPLGPGADVLEDFQSAEDTSAGRTGGTSLNAGRIRGEGGEGCLCTYFFFFFF